MSKKEHVMHPAFRLEGRDVVLFGDKLRFSINTYATTMRPRIGLFDAETGEPYATLTVNEEEVNLEPDEICVKTWNENEPMVNELRKNAWFEDTGKRVRMGLTKAEVWRVKP